METEPGLVADGSQQADQLAYITDAEMPTFLDVFVNAHSFLPSIIIKDMNVCDLACGEGFYSRQLRKLTRGRVMGIERNPDRLKLAKAKEDSESDLKIEYLHVDSIFRRPAFKRELGGCFNLVCSIYQLD